MVSIDVAYIIIVITIYGDDDDDMKGEDNDDDLSHNVGDRRLGWCDDDGDQLW